MSIPTIAEEYAKLMEFLRKAQESSAMIAHLNNADGNAKGRKLAIGWLAIEQQFKLVQHVVTKLAQGRLN